jgi:hypothetical protein
VKFNKVNLSYIDYQTKLQEVFKKLTDLSIKLANTKNEQIIITKEVEKYTKGKSDYTSLYQIEKQKDIVNLKDFIDSKNNKINIERLLIQAKIKKITIDKKVKQIQQEINLLKSKYKEIEILQQKSLKNVVKIGEYFVKNPKSKKSSRRS